MSLKSAIGLDGFDLTIHGLITMALMVAIVPQLGGGEEALVGGSIILAGSLVVLAIRRSLLLRRQRRTGVTTGEMAAERIAELEQRVGDLEAAHGRLAELEERLDFTERLLARSAVERPELSRGEGR